MIEKLKRLSRILFGVHLIAGGVIVALLLVQSQIIIGVGELEAFLQDFERFNFKWLLLAVIVGAWMVPVAMVLIWRRAKSAGLEADRIREMVQKMLAGAALPIKVDIDTLIPLELDEPVSVPIHLNTRIDIDDTVDLDAEVPIKAELPIDTDVVTKVLGMGEVKIPLRATLPLHVMVPVQGRTRLKATGLPVNVDAVAQVELRGIEVPLKGRFETKIDLLSNLETAGEALVQLSKGNQTP